MALVALTDDEGRALLGAGGGRRVAAAVSGGADSMALAFCLKRAGFDVLALIVDHGLREESAREAKEVAVRLAGLGIPAEILSWVHDGIETQIHVKARQARYDLLVQACLARGISKLFVAHHREDQAETVLMRFAKGSGLDGLAGMPKVREKEGVQIMRPFLTVAKARLVATCNANEIVFVQDPSNEKETYARGRLRRVAAALAAEGFTVDRLVDLAERAAEAKAALDFYTEESLRKLVTVLPSGALRVDLAGLKLLPPAIRLRVLGACLQTLAPAAYLPRRRQLVALLAWLEGDDCDDKGRTLYGCRIVWEPQRGAVLLMREVAAITEHFVLQAGEEKVWDGRWLVRVRGDHAGGDVRALGVLPHEEIDRLAPFLRKVVPSGRQRASLPALWQEGKCVAVADFSLSNQSVVTALLKTPFWVKVGAVAL